MARGSCVTLCSTPASWMVECAEDWAYLSPNKDVRDRTAAAVLEARELKPQRCDGVRCSEEERRCFRGTQGKGISRKWRDGDDGFVAVRQNPRHRFTRQPLQRLSGNDGDR